MGCNCKSDIGAEDSLTTESKKITKEVIIKYVLKSLAFILGIIALPIINIFIIWFMFSIIVLNKNVDIKPLLLSISEKLKNKDDDDDDDDYNYDELTPEDVELLDVEDITNYSK
jgi:hypothetical protein